ncbi:RusA family crossover junction endodeoxyribonuclease [Streptomyces roseolus]|uniref:RusA family crossover junction endodeoxyribonuclease n=1 Tax=Streptomyces roseolus TaxID=67358 RepID=UPI00379657C6
MSEPSSLLPAGGREHDWERMRLLAQALAPAAQRADVRAFVMAGEPMPKARHRIGANGRAYKASADSDAENKTGWALRKHFPRPWTGNLALGCVFFRPDRRRMDTDNLIKHVCDAGNGIGWVDDAQITAVYGVVELDVNEPRTLVVVARHLSSLDRSEEAARPARRPR